MKDLLLFHWPCNDWFLSMYLFVKYKLNKDPKRMQILEERPKEKDTWITFIWQLDNLLLVGVIPAVDKFINNFIKKLNLKEVNNIYMLDVVSEEIFNKIKYNNGIIIDHHIWNENKINNLLDENIDIIFEQETCTAGLIAKYFVEQKLSTEFKNLINLICATDTFNFQNVNKYKALSLSNYLKNLVSFKDIIDFYENFKNKQQELENFYLDYQKRLQYFVNLFLNPTRPYFKLLRIINNWNIIILPILELPAFAFNDLSLFVYDKFNIPAFAFVSLKSINNENYLSLSIRSNNNWYALKIAKFLSWWWHPDAAGADIKLDRNVKILNWQDLDTKFYFKNLKE